MNTSSKLTIALLLVCLEYVFGSSRPIFPMDDTSSIHECMLDKGLKLGSTTAKLSDWIYSPYEKSEKDGQMGQMAPLPEGLHTESEHIHMVSKNSIIQWAVVTSDDTVYVVFKGTDNHMDVITDMDLAPIPVLQQHKETKSTVHGGIWNALHFAGNEATDKIKIILKAVIADNPNIKVVLCGHSLGGALAVLCALELLHRDDPVKVDHVIGHGAPQVIEPNTTSNHLWNGLNDITTIYVNEYDVVPRLPSCYKEWNETLKNLTIPVDFFVPDPSYIFFPDRKLPPLLRRLLRPIGSFAGGFIVAFGVSKALEISPGVLERGEDFRHVGRLVFAARDETNITNCWAKKATTLDGKDGDGWNSLSEPPAWSGMFIIENHKEYPEVLQSLLQTIISSVMKKKIPDSDMLPDTDEL